MKTKSVVAIGVLSLVLFLMTGVALSKEAMDGLGGGMGMMQGAEKSGMGKGMMGEGGMHSGIVKIVSDPGFIKEAGLTDAQVAKIKKIVTDTKKAEIKTGAELQILQLELDELLGQASPDVKAVDLKIEEIAKKEAEVRKQAAHKHIDIRAVLTKEQLAMLDEKSAAGLGMGMMSGKSEGCSMHKGMASGHGKGAGAEDSAKDAAETGGAGYQMNHEIDHSGH